MSELGQLLRQARLEKKISLDDVQEATKIRKRYLEAIEEGDYQVLPGSFYVRAFVKTYAEMVGLNGNEIAQYYHHDILTPEPELTRSLVCTRRHSTQMWDRLSRWAPTLLKWAFVILIGVIVYSLLVTYFNPETSDTNIADKANITGKPKSYSTINDKTDSDSIGKNNEETAVQLPERPVQNAWQKPIILLKDFKRSEVSYQVSSWDNGPIQVKMKAVGDKSWLEVYEKNSRGKKLYYETLQKDQELTLDMNKQGLFIRAGYARAIEISVAGQPLNKLDSNGPKNVRLQWLTYDEARQLQRKK